MTFRGIILRLRHVLVLVGILLLIWALRTWGPGVISPRLKLRPGRRDQAGQAVAAGVTLWDYHLGGLPAVAAMLELKTLLQQRFLAPDSQAHDRQLVRRWFVEAFYFQRDVGVGKDG